MYDKAICINLARRPERRLLAESQFIKFGMPDVEFYTAIDNPENGMAGLHQTMINIFKENAGKRLLIFEDDVVFNKSRYYLDQIYINYLPKFFYLFYLGGNATKEVIGTRFDPIRKVTGGFLTSHAILYSEQATFDFAKFMEMPKEVTRENTYDVFLSKSVQPNFHCYTAYPAIASQRLGYSDICGFEVDYNMFHERSKKFYK